MTTNLLGVIYLLNFDIHALGIVSPKQPFRCLKLTIALASFLTLCTSDPCYDWKPNSWIWNEVQSIVSKYSTMLYLKISSKTYFIVIKSSLWTETLFSCWNGEDPGYQIYHLATTRTYLYLLTTGYQKTNTNMYLLPRELYFQQEIKQCVIF